MRTGLARFIACAVMVSSGVAALAGEVSAAGALPFFGVSPWGGWTQADTVKWDGDYLRASTGFSVTSVRKGPTIAGPTVGFEAGKAWREDRWVYGASAQADYMPGMATWNGPRASSFSTRDFAGSAGVKAGYLVRPDLLLYGGVGTTAMNITRVHGLGGAFKDSQFVIQPHVRAGAQWAVTDNLRVTVEVGVQPPLR